jgi:hypothetical protein
MRVTGVRTVLLLGKDERPRATRDVRCRAWRRFQAALDRHLAKPS